MRENVGREGAEDGWKSVEGIKPQRRKGFVHRREKDILSYFFTNFSGEVTVMDLWEEFGRFGRVGEVYIPKKLDKQGRRFGFVKFRVRDAGELLARLEDIWLGSFKLRVNISRFAKGDIRREKEEPVLEGNSTVVRRPEVGKSFKEAVVVVADKNVTQPGLVQGVRDVAWEVEVEPEMMAKLQGGVVGILAEHHDYHIIQNNFIMDGYSNLQVIPLGFMKVLLLSSVTREVEELVGSVGWWSTVFDKFEVWSPEVTSNQRTTWLRCYGIPLHAWGEALFRTIGFKFGSFVEADLSTKNMVRGDLARIRITTDKMMVIDSSVSITVLGKKFVIRVMEELGGATEDGDEQRCRGGCARWNDETSAKGSVEGESVAAVAEGLSEDVSDEDWSDNGQMLHGVGSQSRRKRQHVDTRMDIRQDQVVSEINPNLLGNNLNHGVSRVNEVGDVNLITNDVNRGEEDNTDKGQ
jgi:hypothetical protein